ncbi:MAG: dihydrolipoyl dehydrogenase [Pirellulales bacterium]|nr:dihydrolipoyl dehydrogenase [Pirellulales bacterium]
MRTQLAVIGGGPGGYAAAFLAADLGMEVTLVDAAPALGGTCLQRGCIPSKALLHVAKAIAEAEHLADWGVRFQPPQVDLDAVRARKDKIVATLSGGLGQLASRRKVRVLHARATLVNSSTLRLTPVRAGDCPDFRAAKMGRSPSDAPTTSADNLLEFDHAILATGSVPSIIPGLDPASPRVMDSTVALDLPDVPGSLLVIGGGYIGLELGTVYAALGSRVSVVEMTDGLLPGADRNLVKPLQAKLAARFEAIWLNTRVVALRDADGTVEVTLEGDVEPKVRRFDRVLVAVGRRPNTAGLGLENTQIQLDRRGFVQVDAQQRTAEPRIFAIGDAAGEPMLAHKATHQGKLAVEVLSGRSLRFEPRAIPAVVFTDPEIAWAGLTEADAKAAGRAVEVTQFPWAASGRALAVGRTEGMTKWLVEPQTGRLLGCGIVGAGAGDLIGEAVLAIESGTTVAQLARAIHPHPTLTETLSAAAEVHQGLATDLYRPRRER